MSHSRIIGAVDIGTSKIAAFIGEITGRGGLNILGRGDSSAQGVDKGRIVDFHKASACVHAAIIMAENSAGVKVRDMYVSQSGGHLQGFFNRASVTVNSSDNVVSKQDVEAVNEMAKNKALTQGRVRIHRIRNSYLLDGRVVEDPLKMVGNELEMGVWTVHGDERMVRDNVQTVRGFGLEIEDLIISSVASASMVIDESDKKNGVLVLDVGAGTTDYVLYRNGFVVRTGVLPVGGEHITNDLTLGLRIDRRRAERLKREHVAFVEETPENTPDKVWLQGDRAIGDRQIPLRSIRKIARLRVEELFMVVRKKLEEAYVPSELAAGVVITGGTSRLPGIEEVAARQFGVTARVGNFPRWVTGDINEPEYATALGLLYFALTKTTSENRRASAPSMLKKIFGFAQ